MKTPIVDFVRRYARQAGLRLHMPGHKGQGPLGVEQLDITEIHGADSLYEAAGIIRQSEENAGMLYGADTFYSTEGCSQCIRAMVYLAVQSAHQQGRRPVIAAARNVHKSFLSAAALLDVQICWLYPRQGQNYLSCCIEPQQLDAQLSDLQQPVTAVYVTSPDYLGNMAQVDALAQVCHRHGALLMVDNAHGAYLKFLQPSRHPMDLGADICCDSAHKTLPVLTGGAYLHVGKDAPRWMRDQAKAAMGLFGSTSPSYLILQSLDSANALMAQEYPARLERLVQQTRRLKAVLTDNGYRLAGDEPLKLTVCSKAYGYTGVQIAALLRQEGIECEFADPDYLVLMFSPSLGDDALQRLERALLRIPQKPAITQMPPVPQPGQQIMSIREATLAPRESLPLEKSIGRVLADACVGCPPAVPILVSGERIDRQAAACFAYYGYTTCTVVAK